MIPKPLLLKKMNQPNDPHSVYLFLVKLLDYSDGCTGSIMVSNQNKELAHQV